MHKLVGMCAKHGVKQAEVFKGILEAFHVPAGKEATALRAMMALTTADRLETLLKSDQPPSADTLFNFNGCIIAQARSVLQSCAIFRPFNLL